MIAGVRWQRVPLVIALVLGVVAMHALVLVFCCEVASPPVGSGPVASMAGEHDVAASPPMAAIERTVDAVESSAAGQDTVVRTTADQVPASHHGSGSPSVLHQLMHLCLAILAALMVLAVLRVLPDPAARWSARPGRRCVDRPACPPPRTAVRLAQLCVLRT